MGEQKLDNRFEYWSYTWGLSVLVFMIVFVSLADSALFYQFGVREGAPSFALSLRSLPMIISFSAALCMGGSVILSTFTQMRQGMIPTIVEFSIRIVLLVMSMGLFTLFIEVLHYLEMREISYFLMK